MWRVYSKVDHELVEEFTDYESCEKYLFGLSLADLESVEVEGEAEEVDLPWWFY